MRLVPGYDAARGGCRAGNHGVAHRGVDRLGAATRPSPYVARAGAAGGTWGRGSPQHPLACATDSKDALEHASPAGPMIYFTCLLHHTRPCLGVISRD